MGFIITGYYDHLYSSTTTCKTRSRRLVGKSGSKSGSPRNGGSILTRHHRRDDVVPPGGSIDRVWRGKSTTGHKIDWPVGGLVGYHRRSTHGRGCLADLGSGTLVPRGMDWRSRGGLPGRFRVCGYSVIMQTLADSTERGSTGGSATTNGQKAARCQWLVDRDLGLLVLHGVTFGIPDGISSSGV